VAILLINWQISTYKMRHVCLEHLPSRLIKEKKA